MSMREALDEALRVEDETERLLEVAAVVEEALGRIGVRPVVVGGLAVAYWTAGAYLTGDIDVVMPYLPEADACLAELGFEKQGRFWVLAEEGVFLEAPGSVLAAGEETVRARLRSGRELDVLSTEDLLVYRLHEFVATGHSDAFGQAVMLLDVPGLDRPRLATRMQEEGLGAALVALEEAAGRIRAGGRFESWSCMSWRGVSSERMTRRARSYEAWTADRPRAAAWARRVLASLPTTARERPRDADEAELLRELGAPEHLIGPTREPRDGSPPPRGTAGA